MTLKGAKPLHCTIIIGNLKAELNIKDRKRKVGEYTTKLRNIARMMGSPKMHLGEDSIGHL